MTYVIPEQPRRPTEVDGIKLNFRTHIATPSTNHWLFSEKMVIAQILLYRWAASDEFIQYMVPIAPLWDHLHFGFDDIPSTKSHMGRCVAQAVRYQPKTLKGKTKDNPKAMMCYNFRHRLDLQYGLEWQICSWLRKIVEGEPLEEELDLMRTASDDDIRGLWLEPFMSMDWKQVDWREHWERHKLSTQFELRQVNPTSDERPLLKSLNNRPTG